MKTQAMPKLATVERCESAARAAQLDRFDVQPLRAPFPDLSVSDLVEWRLRMPHTTTFFAQRPLAERKLIAARAAELLGPAPPALVRSVLVITATI